MDLCSFSGAYPSLQYPLVEEPNFLHSAGQSGSRKKLALVASMHKAMSMCKLRFFLRKKGRKEKRKERRKEGGKEGRKRERNVLIILTMK